MTVRSTTTTEFLRYPVAAHLAGVDVDPSAYPVAFAFTARNAAPVAGDWHAGEWEHDGTKWLARIMVGPAGGLVLPIGYYDVHLRVTDDPETPERRVDTLRITLLGSLGGGPQAGPCAPWTTIEDASRCRDCGDADPSLLADMIDVASYTLHVLTAGMFPGLCEDTVTPLPLPAAPPARFGHPVGGGYGRARYGRRWTCGCVVGAVYGGGCGCPGVPTVSLGFYPVTEIIQVVVAGEVVDPAGYMVNDWRWLVRRPDADGRRRSWPCCPDLSDPDAFSVTLGHGAAIPPSGKAAAEAWACQLTLACTGNGEGCELPSKVTSYVRQGVSVSTFEPLSLVEDGKSGIWAVDTFLDSVNPTRARAQATVLSPDIGPDAIHLNTGIS